MTAYFELRNAHELKLKVTKNLSINVLFGIKLTYTSQFHNQCKCF